MSTTSDTQAYKKARRQYLKTTRNRDNSVDSDWTPFRVAEKRYKARFPLPDLSDVLDLAVVVGAGEKITTDGRWVGRPDAVETKKLSPLNTDGRSDDANVYIVPSIPGLVLLPSFIGPEKQKELVRWSLRDQACHPNETNLDIHYLLPKEGLWNTYLNCRTHATDEPIVQPRNASEHPPSTPGPRQLIDNTPVTPENFVSLQQSPKPASTPSPTARPSLPSSLLPKLRWANIGWYYHWGSKQYDFSKGKGTIHDGVRDVCKRAVAAVDWEQVFRPEDDADWGEGGPEWRTWNETYEPDAGIVNFYQNKDTLMAHVDRSEVCATSPLVSISLGNSAIFLIGGLTRDIEPVAILLRSGDAIIMSGPACRRAYHGVPRILEDTLPCYLEDGSEGDDADWSYYGDYLRTARININVRQVFPKGFDPELRQ